LSFATAVLYGLGGYQRGKQQRFEDTEQQRQLTDEEAQTKAEEARQATADQRAQTLFQQQQEDRQRNMGIDPATGKPFVMPQSLTQIRPNNAGKGGPASLQDLYNHYSSLAQYYTKNGQTDLAAFAGSQAAETARQLAAQQAQGAQFQREQYSQYMQNMRDQYNQSHEDQRSKDRESFDVWLKGQPTYSDLHGGGRAHVTSEQASDAKSKWYEAWQKILKPGYSQLGVPLQPVLTYKQQVAAGQTFSKVDKADDPVAVANALAAKEPNPAVKALIIERGRVRLMEKQAQGSGALGGSEADANFIPASPWP
jgi:hypothetical protein